MEITGSIIRIDNVVENNSRRTRNFVLYVQNPRDEKFSDYLQFELYGDRCSQVDAFSVGSIVRVSFDIRGRKYQKKDGSGEAFFTSLSAWSVNDARQAQPSPQAFSAPAPAPQEHDHGLPF